MIRTCAWLILAERSFLKGYLKITFVLVLVTNTFVTQMLWARNWADTTSGAFYLRSFPIAWFTAFISKALPFFVEFLIDRSKALPFFSEFLIDRSIALPFFFEFLIDCSIARALLQLPVLADRWAYLFVLLLFDFHFFTWLSWGLFIFLFFADFFFDLRQVIVLQLTAR